MSGSGSLIGFGLAFLVVSWSLSAALGALLTVRARRRPQDPAIERALAAVAVAAPPLVALLAVGTTLVDSAMRMGQGDHCLPHAHHLHLCLEHGGAWADSPGAVVLAAGAGALFLARLVRIAASQLQGTVWLRALDRVAQAGPGGARLVPSDRVFLFAVGILRPRIFVSSGAWHALDLEQRAAALAHERAHLAGGDLLWRALLSLAAVAGAPHVAQAALAAWDRATERVRDADAAAQVGPDAVAGALVALARRGVEGPGWMAAALAPGDQLVARVDALLRGGPVDRRAGQRLLLAAGGILLLVSVLAAASADPLHHALETILGVF